MRIGVLALQGAFREHVAMLRRLGVTAVEVRLPADLDGLEGLIIPGGESTTIGKLAVKYELMEPLKDFAANRPVWGTCADMIFMAQEIGQDQPLLGLMNIAVERNAFGRQVDSFETDLIIAALDETNHRPFPGIFIRAPRLVEVREGVTVLARLADGTAVAAQEGHWLVTAFHPELSNDPRLHAYFLALVEEQSRRRPDPEARQAMPV